jgi:hypothetical protein
MTKSGKRKKYYVKELSEKQKSPSQVKELLTHIDICEVSGTHSNTGSATMQSGPLWHHIQGQ